VSELLQRLQRALPQIEQWIDTLHARHLRESTRVCDAGFPRLAASFPMALLRATRVASVATVPFPPVSGYGLPEFQAMADMAMAGITFRDMYFVHPSYSSEGVHFHEMIHVVQWKTLGVRPFLLTYGLGILQHEYEHSPLEAIAYESQARFEQGIAMSSVTEHVGRHALQVSQDAAALFRAHGLEFERPAR
jgi:hypothetical protein